MATKSCSFGSHIHHLVIRLGTFKTSRPPHAFGSHGYVSDAGHELQRHLFLDKEEKHTAIAQIACVLEFWWSKYKKSWKEKDKSQDRIFIRRAGRLPSAHFWSCTWFQHVVGSVGLFEIATVIDRIHDLAHKLNIFRLQSSVIALSFWNKRKKTYKMETLFLGFRTWM